jgi:hypothetical protein
LEAFKFDLCVSDSFGRVYAVETACTVKGQVCGITFFAEAREKG